MIIPVAEILRPYLETALTRLRYLHPTLGFESTPNGIWAREDSGIAPEVVSREVNYALYREKVYQETLSLRRSLLAAVTEQ